MNERRTFLEEDQDQDRFLETVNRGVDFARARAVPLTFVGIAAVLVILLSVWLANQRADANVVAYVDIHAALTAYEATAQASEATRSSELTAVAGQLASIQGGPYDAQARFTEARAHLDNGSAPQAAQVFKATAVAGNGAFGLYSQLGYAASLAAQENWAGALAAYGEPTLTPFQDVPGYDAAWTEAALGRAEMARRLGQPDEAKRAYEAIVTRYEQRRSAAVSDREAELSQDAAAFLTAREVVGAATTDLTDAHGALQTWVSAVLAKPEAERAGLTDAVRIQKQIEQHLEARVYIATAEVEGSPESAAYRYSQTMGDTTISPSQTDYQRAQLELRRLDTASAQ
jgi:tetratricopeptide (TPR) repeat protein